jgi:glycosyltransferase involved in cell wall biosynthesis
VTALAGRVAPNVRVVHHDQDPLASADRLCRGYDIGLALEQVHILNRDLCLCNKVFSYMLAGLAIVCTDTKGQRPLAEDLGDGALLYKPGDVAVLAAGLRRWAEDPGALFRARQASWQAAERRWHWEHPRERGALIGALAQVFDGHPQCISC